LYKNLSVKCWWNWHLDDENQEEDDHVDGKHRLVVFNGTPESSNSYEEQEDSTGHNPVDNVETGDLVWRFPVGRKVDQQRCNYHVDDVESDEGVLGAREGPAHHDGVVWDVLITIRKRELVEDGEVIERV